MSTSETGIVCLSGIATRINSLQDEVLASMKRSVTCAVEIGGLLTQAKEAVGHGQFGDWLAGNVAFSDRTARNYMKLWEHRDRLISETVSDLSGAYQLLQADKPKALPAARATDDLWASPEDIERFGLHLEPGSRGIVWFQLDAYASGGNAFLVPAEDGGFYYLWLMVGTQMGPDEPACWYYGNTVPYTLDVVQAFLAQHMKDLKNPWREFSRREMTDETLVRWPHSDPYGSGLLDPFYPGPWKYNRGLYRRYEDWIHYGLLHGNDEWFESWKKHKAENADKEAQS